MGHGQMDGWSNGRFRRMLLFLPPWRCEKHVLCSRCSESVEAQATVADGELIMAVFFFFRPGVELESEKKTL